MEKLCSFPLSKIHVLIFAAAYRQSHTTSAVMTESDIVTKTKGIGLGKCFQLSLPFGQASRVRVICRGSKKNENKSIIK